MSTPRKPTRRSSCYLLRFSAAFPFPFSMEVVGKTSKSTSESGSGFFLVAFDVLELPECPVLADETTFFKPPTSSFLSSSSSKRSFFAFSSFDVAGGRVGAFFLGADFATVFFGWNSSSESSSGSLFFLLPVRDLRVLKVACLRFEELPFPHLLERSRISIWWRNPRLFQAL